MIVSEHDDRTTLKRVKLLAAAFALFPPLLVPSYIVKERMALLDRAAEDFLKSPSLFREIVDNNTIKLGKNRVQK